MSQPLTALRDQILLAALLHVPFDGWTRKAMRLGARDAGLGEADADRAFPYGAADMVAHADAQGYLLLMPNGFDGSWNAGTCCGTASTERLGPSLTVMKLAMALTDPLSSISLPNSAPSRNSGKNCARNCAALPMKVCVQ